MKCAVIITLKIYNKCKYNIQIYNDAEGTYSGVSTTLTFGG
jgi:hypothetical protein